MSAQVFAPIVAQGAVLRRPRAVAVAASLDTNRRGNRLLARLRETHGSRPVVATVFGRRVLVPLSADDARAVLAATPEDFSPATREKRAALGRFEPDAVLVGDPGRRSAKRALNEAALETAQPAHHLAGTFHQAARDEAERLLHRTGVPGTLDWDTFHESFGRLVRRIVLGPAAADDAGLTSALDRVRAQANWGYAWPRRRRDEEAFAERLAAYMSGPHPDSLAGAAHAAWLRDASGPAPAGQVPHWLFAYDAAAIAAFTTLALLAAHPETARRVADEVRQHEADDPGGPVRMPTLRASVLEALRLWPTTLVILRDPAPDGPWGRDADTVAIVSSFFHRDEDRLDFADRFTPDAWHDGRADPARGIVPFSDGPAACPGRDLVLYTAASLLGAILRGTEELRPGRHPGLGGPEPLPHTFDHTRAHVVLR